MPPRRRTEDAPLGRPLFLLNLKSYSRSVGDAALRLGQLLEREAAQAGVAAAIAPAPSDVARLAGALSIPVLSQHADPFDPGARTGYLVPAALKAAGARGSLVNHSEHRVASGAIGATLRALTRSTLVPVLCAGTTRRAIDLAGHRAPYLAIEPPELIGGRISVASARPELISATVAGVHRRAPRTSVLCGAGIHDRKDIQTALELGAAGVLVASAVANSDDPTAALQELLRGF